MMKKMMKGLSFEVQKKVIQAALQSSMLTEADKKELKRVLVNQMTEMAESLGLRLCLGTRK